MMLAKSTGHSQGQVVILGPVFSSQSTKLQTGHAAASSHSQQQKRKHSSSTASTLQRHWRSGFHRYALHIDIVCALGRSLFPSLVCYMLFCTYTALCVLMESLKEVPLEEAPWTHGKLFDLSIFYFFKFGTQVSLPEEKQRGLRQGTDFYPCFSCQHTVNAYIWCCKYLFLSLSTRKAIVKLAWDSLCHWQFHSIGIRWTFTVSSLLSCLLCNQSIFKIRIISHGYLAVSECSTWINLQMCKCNSLQWLQSSFITDPFTQMDFFPCRIRFLKISKTNTRGIKGRSTRGRNQEARWVLSLSPKPGTMWLSSLSLLELYQGYHLCAGPRADAHHPWAPELELALQTA